MLKCVLFLFFSPQSKEGKTLLQPNPHLQTEAQGKRQILSVSYTAFMLYSHDADEHVFMSSLYDDRHDEDRLRGSRRPILRLPSDEGGFLQVQ